jgi:hypothetical protein
MRGTGGVEKQTIETKGLNDHDLKYNCTVDVTHSAGGFLPGVLQVGIDDSLFSQGIT